MRGFAHLVAICLLWALSLLPAAAQEDDKGFLTRSIQDALSGAGRSVRIDGFSGALSSAASFERMTIADKDGVWLVLEDAVLDWNRSALLRGRLEVEKLSAGRLDIPRLPVSETQALPETTAEPFSLPDLPVAIDIADFEVREINLGAPLLGEAAQLSVRASAALTETEGRVDFTATRTDGKAGEFAVQANFDREDRLLTLLLNLSEAEQGIAARLLDLPGKPSVQMRVDGNGPLDDFASEVKIATDGQDRLAGAITLGAQTPRRPSAEPDRRIRADIGGDITALLAPRYRAFFGPDVRLTLDALREASGAIDVSDFALDAQAAKLQGQVRLNQDNWPTFIAVSGRIANPDGTPTLLPVGEAPITVEGTTLRIDYDAQNGEAFEADFDIDALNMTGLQIAKAALALDGTLQGNLGSVGQFLGDLRFDASGLVLNDTATAEAVGDRVAGSAVLNYIEDQPLRIENLDLAGADYGLAGRVVLNGLSQGFLTRLDARLTARDLSRFSALAGREIDGATALALKGNVTPLSGAFELKATGEAQDLAIGIAQADAVMAGKTLLSLSATRDEQGTFVRDLVLQNPALLLTGAAELRPDAAQIAADFRLDDLALVVPQYDGPVSVSAEVTQGADGWRVDARTEGPYAAALTAKGLVTGPEAAVDFTAQIPQASAFAAPFGQDQVTGPLQATGQLARDGQTWRLRTQASGPLGAEVQAQGIVLPKIDMEIDARIADLRPVVPQLRGAARAQGRIRQEPQGVFVDLTTNGPYGARIQAEGIATGPDMSLTFDLDLPNVQPLVPSVSGPLAAKGVVRQTAQGIAVDVNGTGPYATRANVRGVVTGPEAAVDFTLGLANIGALADGINGPLEVTGAARKAGTGWRLDTDARGPSGTQARIDGTVQQSGTLDLTIAGTAPLGLSRPFIAPRNLQGTARFDLALRGPAALSSLSGRIVASNATLSAPNLRVGLRGINAEVGLGGNRATLQVAGQAVDGGQVSLGGSVTLTGSLPADLRLGLREVVLIDPRLYRTSLSGDLRVAGPLTGGALIAGQINVGETIVNVPSTGLTSIGEIPAITHIGDTRPVAATRNRAGVTTTQRTAASDSSGAAGYPLNLTVNAPNRIFVRGRGLDAELGGALQLTGTTNRIISAGRFALVRGRLNILGKRFTLEEGWAQFQGDFTPYIRFVSATDTAQGEVRVIVEGPADSPEVTFESTPEAPQDEVLAQLLFGRNIADISAFQALQLASAVATLAGRGGNGIIGNLRDGFGLDDLDVTTTEDGATALRLGKYISDNVYTDVTASSDGTADVSLNLDITPNLKARGTLRSDGNTSIGIFFEKDY